MEKRLETLMEETKQEIQSMENKLHNLLKMELDNIINLSSQLQQQQVPCNVYFTSIGVSHQCKLIVKMLLGIKMVHLHLLCEHIEGIHVVDNQKGELVTLMSPMVQKSVPYLIIGLTIFSLLLKVGAYARARVGNMIPNFGKGLLALDTKSLGDYLHGDGICKMSTHDPLQGKQMLIEKEVALNMAKDKKSAEQWLVDFLKEKDIYKSFGFSRVQYSRKKFNNHGPLIWRVCVKCSNDNFQNKMLEDFLYVILGSIVQGLKTWSNSTKLFMFYEFWYFASGRGKPCCLLVHAKFTLFQLCCGWIQLSFTLVFPSDLRVQKTDVGYMHRLISIW